MPPPTSGFLHGVASFDPLPEAVLLWTRYTPAGSRVVATRTSAKGGGAGGGPAGDGGGGVTLEWQVSEQPDFGSIAASGTVCTDASKDWTVAVDATGLAPARRYCYRFACGEERSVTGHTKTAPAGPTEDVLFGSVACTNWGFGRFHAYHLLSRVDRLDFVLHCGDYIYEYGKGYYPSPTLQARHGLRPKHECRTLADYRERYACYRSDPALQELHRRLPMVAVNDDHEIADEANTQGSVNHDGTRKEWEQRKQAGIQAYSEWVPARGMTRGGGAELEGVHRTLQWGDLMTLMLVENRVSHRSPHVKLDQTELYRQTALKHPSEWDEGAILEAKAELMRQLADPRRRMIGDRQVADVRADVAESVAAGRPWQLLLSQTVFSTILAPKLQETVHLQPRPLAWVCRKALKYASSGKRAGEDNARLARMYLGLGTAGAPMNPDAYDGYRAERDQLLKALGIEGANPIVLAGDSHNAWCHVLRDGAGRRIGAEFDAPAVTSVGAVEDIYSRFVEKVGSWVKRLFPFFLFTPWVEDALHSANPETLRYCNLGRRGFLLHHVTRRRWHAEFHFVNNVRDQHYKHYCGAAFDVEAGHRGHVHSGLRYLSIGGKIPRREQPRRTALLRLLRGKRQISAPP